MKRYNLAVALVLLCCWMARLVNAQDGQVNAYTQITYDDQTGYVLAEGNSFLYTPWAEVATGAHWILTVELYGPNGYIGSRADSSPNYPVDRYTYVSTYADESGYGEYTSYATPTMGRGSLDYLGFFFFPDSYSNGNSFTSYGGPYYDGMPCYDPGQGFYMDGPCYPSPPAPYLQSDFDLGQSQDQKTIPGVVEVSSVAVSPITISGASCSTGTVQIHVSRPRVGDDPTVAVQMSVYSSTPAGTTATFSYITPPNGQQVITGDTGTYTFNICRGNQSGVVMLTANITFYSPQDDFTRKDYAGVKPTLTIN